MTRVTQAIEACLCDHLHSADAVIQRTRTLAAIEAVTSRDAPPPSAGSATPELHVPRPDLSRFDQFLATPFVESPVSVFFA